MWTDRGDGRDRGQKKGSSREAGALGKLADTDAAYLRPFCTVVNVPLRLVPTFFTTVMMATEMPAAMRPYSMAVAPDSSFTKRLTRVFITWLLRCTRGCLSSVGQPLFPGQCDRAPR